MNTPQLSIYAGLGLCLAMTSTGFAQTSAGSMLYTPTVNLSAKKKNSFAIYSARHKIGHPTTYSVLKAKVHSLAPTLLFWTKD
jgi:hypothetical protein